MSEYITTKMGEDHCPKCNHSLALATSVTNKRAIPNPEDITICINCGEILEFADDMDTILITDKKWKQIQPVTRRQVLLAQTYIRARGTIKYKNDTNEQTR